jgi:putative transposase
MNLYRRYRFPAEIISRCIWFYFRLCLGYRHVEELMLDRGGIATYEPAWCGGHKFGQRAIPRQSLGLLSI